MIIDRLINKALTLCGDRRIIDARIGLEYACVLLEDSCSGLAYIFKDERAYNAVLDSGAEIIGAEIKSIIPWAADSNRFKAALGLAAINAVLNTSSVIGDKVNINDTINLKESDVFGMVGDFPPVINRIAPMTDNIYVFELNVKQGSGFYTWEEELLYLPKCSHVLITASTLINHTIDEVLSYCIKAKEVYLVGPSAPLCSEVFDGYNVTAIAGSIVKRPELIMPVISLCGGTRFLKPLIEQVVLRL
jgi:uncharacterized protein (DUF4213/DUF364 family)